jgi:hypothetical protein
LILVLIAPGLAYVSPDIDRFTEWP